MAANDRVVFHEGEPVTSIDLVLLCDVGITRASGALQLDDRAPIFACFRHDLSSDLVTVFADRGDN